MKLKNIIREALEASEEKERQELLEKENKLKKEDSKYLIKSTELEVDIVDFLSNFEKVYEVEELAQKKYYSFKIKDDEEGKLYELISDIFDKHSDSIISLKKEGLSIMDLAVNGTLMDAYISEFNYIHDKERLLSSIKNSDDWDNKKKNEQLGFKELNLDDTKETLSKFIFEVYDLTKEDSERLTNVIYNEVLESLNDAGTMISDFHITAGDINGKISDKLDKLEKIEKTIFKSDFNHFLIKMIDSSNSNKIIYFKKETKMKGSVLKEFGSAKLTMRDQLEWEESYLNGDEETEKRIEKKLRDSIKKCNIPNAETVTGFPTLGFFNYYNISEREYCTTYPLIREVSNIILAKKVALDRELFADKIENILLKINKGEKIKFNEIDFIEKGKKEIRKTPRVKR